MDDNTVNNNIENRVNNTQEASVHATPKELPISILRLEVQRTIERYTETFQCSRDFVTSAVFCIVGTLCGKHVTVINGVYRNHPNMWVCHVGSACLDFHNPVKHLLQPVLNEQYTRIEEYEEKLKSFQRKKSDRKPTFDILVDSEASLRSLYEIMDGKGESKDGFLLYEEGISEFVNCIKTKRGGGDTGRYNMIWDGTPLSVVRKTQPSMMVMDPFLSIMGGIHPAVLRWVFKPYQEDVGFIQRWLFVYPDEQKIPLYFECTLDSKYEAIWNEIISKLLKMEDQEYVLSEEAKQIYRDYCNDTILRTDSADIYVSSLLAKLRIHVLKWCAVVHVLSCTEGAESFALPTSMVITAEEMRYSVECMRYFEYCGVKVMKHILEDKKANRKSK